MSKQTLRNTVILLVLFILGSLMLAGPNSAEAGIFEAGNEVTYKEYWVPHTQFTGGCNDDGTPTSPSGSWYMEPHTLAKCPKTVTFTLPDDFTNAVKIELYLDLWRNYNIQAATFKINNGATIYRPPVGSDWSRSPYVTEINKSEFVVGQNTMTFWGDKKYHIHDIGLRIYYNNDNPLVPAPGSDVTPPDGHLTSIQDDNGTVSPDAGGTLMVNNDQLKLTADFSADTAYIEFHAWYEGYDEDNNRVFRDWHNLGRNNWWPGGKEEQPTGGVINHIVTVKPKKDVTTASVTWAIPHITNQAKIKFKIRVVDAAGNVREAAGGESADFKLMRATPVNAFIIHDFVDTSIHMDGSRPDMVEYSFTMPGSVTSFTQAYLVGAYWRNPNFSINSSNPSTVAAGDWSLGIKLFSKNYLVVGTNKIAYLYSGNGQGHFIERPGPMFVLRGTNPIADTAPPAVSKQNPAPNATNVDVKSSIIAHVGDELFGVDWTTVVMTVNGEDVTNKARLEGVMGDYRLVYKTQGNLAFSTEYNVNIEACDLKGNCMPPVNYKFTTADPDTTPPVVSDIVVSTLPIGADISWKTNEPATTRIEYGKTTGYGSVIEETTLKTTHSVQIRGLQPTTQYHFKIFATDEQNNTGNSGDQTFTTLEFGELLSDDFNSCQLNSGIWQTLNIPAGSLFMTGEKLEISVPGGSSHDFDSPGGPPRIMQSASNGDLAIDVKFDSVINMDGQVQGILLEEDADTYARFGFERTAAKGALLYARFVADGVQVKAVSSELGMTESPPFMRVTRTGNSWKWYWSLDGVSWTMIKGTHQIDMTVVSAGVFAGNSGLNGTQPAHKAIVDYFFNVEAPIDPEDGSPIDINVTTVGTGMVVVDPEASPYICGAEVLLTATTTAPGWSFTGWSGDLTGTASIAPVVMNAPKNITATFTQDQYLLNINIENDGIGGSGNAVTKSPDQPTYVYDDVVQLTAVPEPGWKFVEWAGAASGTNPVVSVTMRQHETVIARFEQEQYTLDVNLVHNGVSTGGSVDVSPLKSTYVYGDVVTLSAAPNPGWTFGGWSGAVTSGNPVTQVIITGDTTATATFDQIKYEIDLTIVGGGEVTLKPQKDYYLYNDVVEIHADGGTCWSFIGWGGALTGTGSPQIVTITDNLAVTATFQQKEFTLTVNKVGPGNVAITPAKAKYACGEMVTLQANPITGNYFAGWSGDLPGAQNPITFPIEKNTTVTATFTSNPPPTIDPVSPKTVLIGQPLSFTVHAQDPGGEPLSFTAENMPPGAKLTDNGDGTGVFNWTPGLNQAGEYEVIIIASDGTGQASVTVTITVKGYALLLPAIVR